MENIFKPLTLFRGAEIGPAIIAAVEAVPAGNEIVTMKAGENMPVTICFIPSDEENESFLGGFPEYAWDGESFRHIGEL